MFGILKALRRRWLKRRQFPDEWLPILEKRAPFFAGLSGKMREHFLEMLKVFVWEKHFIGAKDFKITGEVKVTIAAAAVRLVLFRDLSYYNRLTEIVVYPTIYTHPGSQSGILGEAHSWGTVVLSWPAVLHGLQNPADGRDTASHEFAHVLDHGDGMFDGTPELDRRSDYQDWGRVLSFHFLKLRKRGKDQRRVLDMYGASNEAEFFAVATESYFEKPKQMETRTPDLYAELQKFYGGDPAAHPPDPTGPTRRLTKIGRNDPCYCGSSKKYKKCCGRRT
jgi:Mlc titration factor MtfA (ptsG expression regulator)